MSDTDVSQGIDDSKGLFIEDLIPGTMISPSVFVIKGAELKDSKAGGQYISLTLSDWTGSRDARRFKPTTSDIEALLESRFAKITGRVETKPEYAGQIIIDTAVSISPVDHSPFIKQLPPQQAERWRQFGTMLRSVAEPNLQALLRAIFDAATLDQFKRAVAASSHHHDYPGGLLEHTLEVACLCDRACTVLPGLRRDLLVTGALLHDLGKLDEMEHGVTAGAYTTSGNLVGHIVSGAMRVARAAGSIDGFPDSLLHGVTHLILSHHGQLEYGAAKEPLFAEAFVLAQCDVMSARVFQCRRVTERAVPGQTAVRTGPKEFVFVGPIQIDENVTVTTTTATSFSTVRTYHVLGAGSAASAERNGSAKTQETRDAVPPAGGADFLLRVADDGMAGTGILKGDLVFVRKEAQPSDGQIVVANIPGTGAMVKRLQLSAAGATLTSAGAQNDPITITEKITIQGVVTGVIRDFD